LIELLLPFAVGVWLWKRYGASWKVFFIGALAFVASQIVHLPLLYLVDLLSARSGIEQSWPMAALLALNAVILGLLSGLCEEVARWFSFKMLKAENKPFRSALMLGAGHGGIESFLVGFSVLGSAISLILYLGGNLTGMLPPEAAAAYAGLAETPWYLPLLGAFERVAAVTLHLSLSCMVWLGVRYHKPAYLVMAIAWHGVVNGVVVYLGSLGWSPLALEGVMAVVMAASAGYIAVIYRKHGTDSLFHPSKLPDPGPQEDLLQEGS
jgi:uncharacterized membrane protein YhfC